MEAECVLAGVWKLGMMCVWEGGGVLLLFSTVEDVYVQIFFKKKKKEGFICFPQDYDSNIYFKK